MPALLEQAMSVLTTAGQRLWLLPALPLLAALLIPVCSSRPNLREAVTLLAAACLFLLALGLMPVVGDTPEAQVLWHLLPGLSFALQGEALGVLFALLASFLWLVTAIYTIGYMRGYNDGRGAAHQTRFYAAFAVAIAATMGVALAANLFTLFVCYEILTLSTYPLVTHAGTDAARQGGRVYLGTLLGTSIGLQFIAIVGTWLLTGSLDFQAGGLLSGEVSDGLVVLLLLLYIFGIGKAALMPVHRWLPAAMVAPTPVSALLHAVAVVKAGVFTVLKVLTYVVGPGFFQGEFSPLGPWVQQLLIYLAIFSLVVASLVALRQDNLKRRLAYSTVSQLAYILLGGFLAHTWGLIGAAMHIATHAFGKITLFFAAGAIYIASHKTEVSTMQGLGRRMPVTFACFLLGSLSVIGMPLFGGFWSKWYLAYGAVETGQWLALTVLMASSLLNIAYLLPVPIRAFSRNGNARLPVAWSLQHEAPWPCLLAMGISVVGCLLLFFWPQGLYQLASLFAENALAGVTVR